MKYLIFITLGLSFLWELSFLENSFASIFKTSLGSSMWCAALVYLYDFYMALRGKNSAYMIEFHSRLKKDIIICSAFGVSLLPIFSALPTPYTFSNIDLACLGLPFLISSFLDLPAAKKLKVAGLALPKRVALTLLMLPVITYGVFIYWLREILNNQYPQSQALWMQITILLTGIYSLFGAGFIRFAMEKQRLEFSPVLLELFTGMKASPGLYAAAAKLTEQWNAEVKSQKVANQNIKRKSLRKRRHGRK